MSTKFNHLGEDDLEQSRRLLVATYLIGQCYHLAIALHRELDFDLVGCVEENGHISHAGVRWPLVNLIFDARGLVSERIFKDLCSSSTVTILPINEKDLHAIKISSEEEIERAVKMAQIAYPNIAWKNKPSSRIGAFMDEIEKVCRKHNLWIRSPYPAAKPIICEGSGDEDGYDVETLIIGGYRFDRRLG